MHRVGTFVAVVASCSGHPAAMGTSTREPEPRAPVVEVASAAPSNEIAPLDAPALEKWALDGGVEAWVSAPVGAREKRPLVVGVHGSGDRAEWACEKWRSTLGTNAFVVCPRGVKWRPYDTWGPPVVLAERADLGIAAVRAKYGAYVADGPVTYAGFSLGATIGAEVIAMRPGVYDSAILVELGHTPLGATRTARNLAAGGATRVIIGCATRPCLAFEKRLVDATKDGPVHVTLADGGIGRGHFFDEPMIRALADATKASFAAFAR